MLQHFTWITAAGKGDCEFFRIDLFYSVSVGLIKAGVAVYFVEIIDTEIIARRFIFNNVMLAEYSAYGFLNGKIPQLFNNKDMGGKDMRSTLEVCVDSTLSAVAAQEGGADRIELCSDLIIGGITPGHILAKQIKDRISIPIRALIRPRFGDFCYNEDEFSIMLEEIRHFPRKNTMFLLNVGKK